MGSGVYLKAHSIKCFCNSERGIETSIKKKKKKETFSGNCQHFELPNNETIQYWQLTFRSRLYINAGRFGSTEEEYKAKSLTMDVW